MRLRRLARPSSSRARQACLQLGAHLVLIGDRDAVLGHDRHRAQNPQQRTNARRQMRHGILQVAPAVARSALRCSGSLRSPMGSMGRIFAACSHSMLVPATRRRSMNRVRRQRRVARERGARERNHVRDTCRSRSPAAASDRPRARSCATSSSEARGELRMRSRNGVMPASSAALSIGSMCRWICALLNSASTSRREVLDAEAEHAEAGAPHGRQALRPTSHRCDWC